MQEWAEALRSHGIQRVTGRIIADDNLFDDELIPESWYYGYLSDWYAAESSALCLNDNCYTVYVSPGEAEGDPVKVRTVPPDVYGEFIVSATTAAKGTRSRIRVDRGVDTNRITVRVGFHWE
jgi:D-alanyl-D-alanine carboxypeptidase/D-alanyl-D-alanine-endopeptidase (penicillin-binding protein 4)